MNEIINIFVKIYVQFIKITYISVYIIINQTFTKLIKMQYSFNVSIYYFCERHQDIISVKDIIFHVRVNDMSHARNSITEAP